MAVSLRSLLFTITVLFSITSVKADWAWGGGGGHWHNGTDEHDWNGCPPWWKSDSQCDNSDNDGTNSNSGSGTGGGNGVNPSQYGLTATDVSTSNRIIIAHAVLASIVWVLFIPMGGILLRLGFKSPWIVRTHALLQSISYVIFIVAAGMGIWLVQKLSYGPYSLWDDPHTKLGVAILAVAFVQPFLGLVHHLMFKRRVRDLKEGTSDKQPGRTLPSYGHLWIGRILIVLGMINGGLGIRLASASPFASNQRSKAIAYGVCAGLVFVIYAFVVTTFEFRKIKADRKAMKEAQGKRYPAITTHRNATSLPSYDQSQESIRETHKSTARYQ